MKGETGNARAKARGFNVEGSSDEVEDEVDIEEELGMWMITNQNC